VDFCGDIENGYYNSGTLQCDQCHSNQFDSNGICRCYNGQWVERPDDEPYGKENEFTNEKLTSEKLTNEKNSRALASEFLKSEASEVNFKKKKKEYHERKINERKINERKIHER